MRAGRVTGFASAFVCGVWPHWTNFWYKPARQSTDGTTMILYTLRCSKDHHWEQWFDNSADYDAKKTAGAMVCPECGDTLVSKAIMAPNVRGSGQDKTPAPAPACPSGPMGGCGMCPMAGQH